VNKLVICPGEEGTASFCGSAVYHSGVKGSLDLYHGDARIASLHWKGPWARTGNQFEATNVNSAKYLVDISNIPKHGILGDISVIVTDIAC
jgi:hypothetical protein